MKAADWIALCNLGVVVGTAAILFNQSCTMRQQARSMGDQLTEMRSSGTQTNSVIDALQRTVTAQAAIAEAARSSAETARMTLQQTFTSALSVTLPQAIQTAGQRQSATIIISNNGLTNAHDILMQADAKILTQGEGGPSPDTLDKLSWKRPTQPDMAPAREYLGQNEKMPVALDFELKKSSDDGIITDNTQARLIAVFGRFKYRDAMNLDKMMSFCGVYKIKEQSVDGVKDRSIVDLVRDRCERWSEPDHLFTPATRTIP